ncbi:MAG: hypothetical protein Q8O83_03365 [bacterium]|nr:hypothetical protein [bacterium]
MDSPQQFNEQPQGNMPSGPQQPQSQPQPQPIPSMPMGGSGKKSSSFLVIVLVLAAILIIAGAWFYFKGGLSYPGDMVEDELMIEGDDTGAAIDLTDDTTTSIEADLEGTDLGDIDAEFEEINIDLENL